MGPEVTETLGSVTEEKCQSIRSLIAGAMTEVDSLQYSLSLGILYTVMLYWFVYHIYEYFLVVCLNVCVIYRQAVLRQFGCSNYSRDFTWRMWLPDERKQFSIIYCCYTCVEPLETIFLEISLACTMKFSIASCYNFMIYIRHHISS